jgi:carbon storage regulator CsrA
MLSLTRRLSETVRIREHISVTALGVKANQPRIGFAAPQNIA